MSVNASVRIAMAEPTFGSTPAGTDILGNRRPSCPPASSRIFGLGLVNKMSGLDRITPERSLTVSGLGGALTRVENAHATPPPCLEGSLDLNNESYEYKTANSPWNVPLRRLGLLDSPSPDASPRIPRHPAVPSSSSSHKLHPGSYGPCPMLSAQILSRRMQRLLCRVRRTKGRRLRTSRRARKSRARRGG